MTYDRYNYPQKTIKGDTWRFEYQIKQVIDSVPTPVDISTWTFEGWVSPLRSSPDAEQTAMTVTIVNAALGQVRFSIDEALTEVLPLGSLYYQIRYTTAGDVTTIFKGPFMVQ